MSKLKLFSGVLLVISFGMILSGCGSDPARDLANKTGIYVLTVSTQLRNFKATQQRVAEVESERLESFVENLVEDEAFLNNELAARTEAAKAIGKKGSNLVNRYKKLRSLVSVEEKNARLAEVERSKIKAEIAAGQQKLEVPTTELKSVSEKLVVLGKDESLEDRVKFLIEFGTQVNEAIKEAEKTREEALAKGK